MITNVTQPANTTICEKHNVELKEGSYKLFGDTVYRYQYCELCDNENRLHEQAQEEERELLAQKYKEEARIKRDNAGIPNIFIGSRLEHFKAIDPVLEWVKNPVGFLFVHGCCGCGKSYLSSAIKYAFNTTGIQSDLFFCSDMFLRLRNSFKNKDEDEDEFKLIKKYAPDETKLVDKKGVYFGSSKEEVPNKHVAIFDDVGAQKISEYAIEAWYNIIDRRYMFQHPTMFTSNLSLKEISICMTDRIASRLASGKVFELKGPDRRLSKA